MLFVFFFFFFFFFFLLHVSFSCALSSLAWQVIAALASAEIAAETSVLSNLENVEQLINAYGDLCLFFFFFLFFFPL